MFFSSSTTSTRPDIESASAVVYEVGPHVNDSLGPSVSPRTAASVPGMRGARGRILRLSAAVGARRPENCATPEAKCATARARWQRRSALCSSAQVAGRAELEPGLALARAELAAPAPQGLHARIV